MNRQQLTNAIVAVIVVALLAIAGVAAYYYIRQPDKSVTLSKESSERVWTLLKEANYVSPTYPTESEPGRAIYLIAYKGCDACVAYEVSEFPKFRAAGIETRVYTFSPTAGQSRADNAAIVQIWLTRNWVLYDQWAHNPGFKNEGVPPADDMARKYVLKATQDLYTKILAELPAKNPSDLHAPLVLWATADNQIKVCYCDIPNAYHNVSDDFTNVKSSSKLTIPTFEIPENIPGFGGSSSSSSAKPVASGASSSSADGSHPTDFGPAEN